MEASRGALAAINFAGFQFSYRTSYFDWRLLHGIDVELLVGEGANSPNAGAGGGRQNCWRAQVRLTDVRAVEDALETLQLSNFDSERGLSVKNCMQVGCMLGYV